MLGNEVIIRQLKNLKAKKIAAVNASKVVKKAPKQLDEATMKEVS